MKIWVLSQVLWKKQNSNIIFNKGLSKDYKKEGLLKKLKNIEDKNEELQKIINR